MSETKIVAIPTHVKAVIDKNGRKRPAHISTRHRAVPVSDEPVVTENATPFDGWIAKHGGAEHLRKTLEDMTADQRAKLLDAMAQVDGSDAAAVMKKLGIHEPEASEDQAAIDAAIIQFRARMTQAKEEGVITLEEYDSILTTQEEDGLEYALEQLAALRTSVVAAAETIPAPVEVTAPVVVAQAEEGAAGIRAALEAQAASIYQQHVTAQNMAHRANFEIEKRGIRGWKVPQAMHDEAQRLQDDAAKYLAQWTAFVQENGLGPGLS